MQAVRFASVLAASLLMASAVLAQAQPQALLQNPPQAQASPPQAVPQTAQPQATPPQPMGGGMVEAKTTQSPSYVPSPACVPGALIEAYTEGAWYTAVVLDQLRDGRCFVHYDNYGEDDDEALAPKHIRARR